MKRFLKIIIVVLVFVFLCVLVAGLCVSKTKSNAKGIRSNITVGMNVQQVHQELKGRYVCNYQIQNKKDAVKMVSKDDFLLEISGPNTTGEMGVHVLGLTPYKASFKLRFDSQGLLYEKTDPYGWD